MQAQEAIKNRRSCREFLDKTIPKEMISNLVDAGRLAASARNVQPWEFIAVTDKANLKKIANLADNGRFISACNCCLAIFCQETKYYLEDGCAATANILIASTDLGLASCWVAGDKKPYCGEVKTLLGVPAAYKLVSLIALGYAKGALSLPAKRQLKEVLHWERY